MFFIAILPLFRTDYILLSFSFSLYLLLKGNRNSSAIVFLCSLLFYFIVNKYAGNYGYLTIFNVTLISNAQPYPESMIISKSFIDYAKAYMFGAIRVNNLLTFPLVVSFLVFVFTNPKTMLKNKYFSSTVISLLFIILHFSLFPSSFQRSYVLFNLMVFIFFAESLSIVNISKTIESIKKGLF